MSDLRQTLKQTLPPGVVQVLKDLYDATGRLKDYPAATFHPWRRDSVRKLAQLKDSHRGERCFIIGNGPSLRKTDLSKLRDEKTIGMNRFFLAFPEMGFETTYFLSVNDLVVEQSRAELQALQMPCFFSWRARQWMEPAENVHFLYTTYTGPKFARDVTGRVWEGGTVTYVALQLAFHLGFDTVILIGVDHSYGGQQGAPNATVVSQGDDPNHFHPGYFGKGFRWQLPDLIAWEDAYRLARRTYEQAGRQVLDATIGGKLTVFPKVDYDGMFE
jgi:hypothetical protein